MSGSMTNLTAAPTSTAEDLNKSNLTRPNLISSRILPLEPVVTKLINVDPVILDVARSGLSARPLLRYHVEYRLSLVDARVVLDVLLLVAVTVAR